MIFDFCDADESLKKEVWEKGITTELKNPKLWRKDFIGKWIYYPDFLDTTSMYGWGIDYIVPPEEGGTSDPYNLKPTNIDK